MTLVIFMSLTIALLSSSIFSVHPLVLTVKVLLLANALCLTLAHTTTWYAYMLYMVMVGGMLVMFTYISSLSPNGIFQLKLQLAQLATLSASAFLLIYSISLTPNTVNTQNHHNTPENFIAFFMQDENSKILATLAAILLLAMLMSMALLPKVKAPMRAIALLSSSAMYTSMTYKTPKKTYHIRSMASTPPKEK
uniref:NADH dehydrogenase subunit 6 n=1 Tax=Potomida littoralis TaxID=165005 RepID=A0A0U2S9H9_9BIVA|nr:NADH dehydrogenase subunit 6 [Potomida littoralis]